MEPELDPERHLKKLALSFGVTNQIAKLVKNRPKLPNRTAEEIEEELLTKAKGSRENRVASFGPIQRHIFGLVAKHYNISVDDIIEGVADSDEDTDILQSFCSKNGHSVIVFLYSKLKCPGKETGRYDPAKENLEEMRVTCTDGYTQNHCGSCAAICRQQTDIDLDMKTIMKEISVEELNVEESETLKSAIERLINDLNLPLNVQLRREKAPPVEGPKKTLRIEYDLEHLTDFEVNHKLFKGHLLVPFQIKETSRKRELVEDVKSIFDRWLQQIRIILIQDKQITRDSNNVGPSDELIYWQKRVERYKQISEFIASRPFINHLTCLQYTRAKLLKKWKSIEEEFNELRLESENNVQTLEWLNPFWDPLYTCTPTENCEPVNRLVSALRDKYNDSANYNRSECMTSFLVKTTNQLVISCRNYLNNNSALKVLKQEPSIVLQKISDCETLLKKYEESYFQIVDSMNETITKPWTCSATYIFGISNEFKDRLQKIRNIIDTKVTYSVLDKIKISGMERYRNQIVFEYNEIAEKPYSPLNNWVKQFDSDYVKWNKATEAAEIGMQKFVKQSMAPIQNTSAMLLLLKRFERLNLDCLCLERRYLDVVVMLEKEMDQIKDAYNELRDNPPLMKGTPPVYGRILWIRGLQRRIDEVIHAIKAKPCVVKHAKAQIAVKCYNYMTEMFLKYEHQQHDAWYNFVEHIRKRLGQYILRRNPNTHMLEVNFHASVYEMIREGEGMSKLGLDIPNMVQTVCFYRDVLLNAVETLKQFIKRNNNLRSTIDKVFMKISRPIFRKLDEVFKDGLKNVQWDSKDLATYFAEVDKALTEVTDFFKNIDEIKRRRIEASFHYISNTVLVVIPDEPVPTDYLYNLNNTYRSKINKRIENKSAIAEQAAVDIINKFVEMIEVKTTDENGATLLQLPLSSQNENNYREEQHAKNT